MSKQYITLKVTCCHQACGKSFHHRPEISKDQPGETDQVIDCLHCGQPVKIRIPKVGSGPPTLMVRSANPGEP